jgi:hypothetical protein
MLNTPSEKRNHRDSRFQRKLTTFLHHLIDLRGYSDIAITARQMHKSYDKKRFGLTSLKMGDEENPNAKTR